MRGACTAAMLLASIACSQSERNSAAKPAPLPATPAVGTLGPSRSADSVSKDPWVALADSALRAYLPHLTWGASAGLTPGVRDCNAYQGDNPLQFGAAVRGRIIGHDSVKVDSTPDMGGPPLKFTTFRVEMLTAAHLIPAWAANLPPGEVKIPPEGLRDSDPAVVSIAPRLDTLDLMWTDIGGSGDRWALCSVIHEHDPYTIYWGLTRDSAASYAVKWEPAGGSWARVTQLADSLKRAAR
jgi:hypothetical protein